jgi:hypothetical protein
MATTPGPKAPVQPPAPLLPTRSLVAALPPVPLEDGAAAGVSHVEGRGTGAQGPLDWCSPGDVTITDACDVGDRTSFALVAGELRPSQSTFAGNRTSLDERQASARLNMERSQSYVIAQEILYGAATIANAWGNPYLTDPAATDVITTAPQPYNRAIDRITDVWADAMLGERGIIHMPPAVARVGVRDGYLVERGTQLVDVVMGHIIVTDAGYANATFDGESNEDDLHQIQWIFMSPNIDIRWTPIEFSPATVEEMNGAVVRSTNVLSVRAFRVVSYTWEQPAEGDTEPPVLAIPVDLCSPDCVPGAS